MRVRLLTALLVITCAASVGPLTASAQNLIQVWQAALGNDPSYAAARANYRAGLEKEPQARALLLPLISAEAGGAYQETRSTRGLRYAYSGGRGVWDLALTQPKSSCSRPSRICCCAWRTPTSMSCPHRTR